MVAHINMQSKKIDGIVCDLCNIIYTDKFEYYSTKFDLVEVDRSMGKVGPKHVDRRYLDLDICTVCMDKVKKQVMDGIAKREKEVSEKQSVWTAGTIVNTQELKK